MAAIFIKVGALALKTLAKPLSNRFQAYVMSHPQARQKAITAAQWTHRLEVLITRGAEGKGGKVFVGDMTEEKSLELASKLVSEGFVFFVGMVIVMFEYQRQARKDDTKKRAEHMERQRIMENARAERERLARENREQTELIERLIFRVDKLEDLVRQREEEERRRVARKGWFGGFIGPRAPGTAPSA
mmetsp:Transcript_31258/g.79716  ORF Transcript_31258/g.79716 Transcript_31258/m.79716 type:complete len:188 (-) Transcript_31258:359-922(-)